MYLSFTCFDMLQIDLCIHANKLNTYYPYYISNILEDNKKRKLKILITNIQKIKMQLLKLRLLLK